MSFLRILFPLALALSLANPVHADVINLPLHNHGNSPICTFPVAGCDSTLNHNHRTGHHIDGTGAEDHGMVAHYMADSSWMNDRSYHVIGAGHAEFGHGHQDVHARFHVHAAEAGAGVTATARDNWNNNISDVIARMRNSFRKWMAVGNAGAAKNWPGTDNDHVAGTGIEWHSSVAWKSVAEGDHEVHVVLADLPATTLGRWDDRDAANLPGLNLMFNGDDSEAGDAVTWYFGLSTDKTVAPDSFDFYSTAIHEVGHVLGLLHTGTFASGAIMTTEEQTARNNNNAGGDGNGQGIFRTIDASAIHGVRDLYAIPGPAHAVPEPFVPSLMLIGLGACWAKRIRPLLASRQPRVAAAKFRPSRG